MHGLRHYACSNCWFNGLQYGAVGLSVGYCAEYRVVLRQPDETTCGRHVRKDLMLDSALTEKVHHRMQFSRTDGVQLLVEGEPVSDGTYATSDATFVRRDPVGEIVADYGEYRSKIESLAQLRAVHSFRADVALTSLARSYTHRCVDNGGRWTSGLHIFWWTRKRLIDEPEPTLAPEDLRLQTATTLERQVELARWSLLMFRLVLISDVGTHALQEQDEVGNLSTLAERAAAETVTPRLRKLVRWIRSVGLSLIDLALPKERYVQLAQELHQERKW
jgi:hypothetical protein